MNSFSINAYEHQTMLDYYKQWLVRDLYTNLSLEKLDDPAFLQKLSIIQADGIRRDIGMHAAITHNSIQSASTEIGRKIQSAANLITSSLDDGFTLMNQRMVEVNSNLGVIGKGIGEVNNTLQQGNQILSGISSGIEQTNLGIAQMNRGIGAVASGINALGQNMTSGMNALNKNMAIGFAAVISNISQATSMLRYQLQQVNNVLQAILNELKIPESQRERRYHIEEGMKYFNKGMKSGDCLYFEDALEEFTTATSIERKDFFSWYYIGMIHLYSKDHLDFDKALLAFDRYIHYADALTQKHNLFDEALMMKAECYYLKQDVNQAYQTLEAIVPNNIKAALRGMKYLSASGVAEKQIQAVELLKRLMQQNPYIVMQVLEDFDLVNNNYIIEFVLNYRSGILKDIPDVIATVKNEIKTIEKYSYKFTELNERLTVLNEELISPQNKIGIVDLLRMKDDALSIIDDAQRFKTVVLGFQEGLAKIQGPNGKWGFIDETGCIVIPCSYRSVNDFHEGLAAISDEHYKHGFIDKTGRLIVSCIYDWVRDFDCGVARVEIYGTKMGYGLIDKTGRLITPCQWKEIDVWQIKDGYAKVKNFEEKWGIMDKTGHLVSPCQWKEIDIWHINEGYAKVKNFEDKWGAIDTNGRIIVRFYYNNASDFYIHKNYKGQLEVL